MCMHVVELVCVSVGVYVSPCIEAHLEAHVYALYIPDDSSPQIPLAESSTLSLTECREERHSSHPAGAQAKSERAQARGPCVQ